MASLLSPRRTGSDIHLKATVPHEEEVEKPSAEPDGPVVSWLVASICGALATAGFGWVIVAGLCVVGWLAAEPGSLLDALEVGSQLWLLSNGGGAQLGELSFTLVPLGVTALFAFMLSRFAAFAARQASGEPRAVVGRVVAVMTGAYLVPVVAASLIVGDAAHAVRAAGCAIVTAGLGSVWGSCRAVGYDPTERWPAWSRAVPRAVVGAQAVMLIAGSAALATSLIIHVDRVRDLTGSLQAGVVGGIALAALQLAFTPNAVIWAASYTLGAGFTVGQGSVVAPRATDLGLLPAFPMLGALPAEGAGNPQQLFWLAAGVLAGAVAAFLVMKRRPNARFDETSLVGGLAGVLAGLVFVGLAWLSSGDLGSGRLTDVGPRLLPLMVMSPTMMGLAGMITGLVFGLIRKRPAPPPPEEI